MPNYYHQSTLAEALGLSLATLRRQQSLPTTIQERAYQLAYAALRAGIAPAPALTKQQLQTIFEDFKISGRTLRRYRHNLDALLGERWFALAVAAVLAGLEPVPFLSQKARRDYLWRKGGALFVEKGRFQKGPTTDPFKQEPRK